MPGASGPVALLVAAGSGSRLGASVPKAFVPVAGRPMIEWSRRRAAGGGDRGDRRRAAGRRVGAGGLRRRARRRDALGVRARGAGVPPAPGTWWCTTRRVRSSRPTLFTRVLEALESCDCAIAAARVTDTVKEAGADGARRRDARPLAAVGGADAAGLPARGARGGVERRRGRARRAPPTTPRWSSAPAAPCAWSSPRPRTSRSPRRTTCRWRSCSSPIAERALRAILIARAC